MKNNIEIIKNARVDWCCTLSDETVYNIRESLAKKVASIEVNDEDMEDAEYDSDKLLQTACDIASKACDDRKSVMRMFKDNTFGNYEQFLDIEEVVVRAICEMNSKFYKEFA